MNPKIVSINKAATLLGVDQETLRNWDKSGALVPIRTAGKHRQYKISDIEKLLGIKEENVQNSTNRVAIYGRVSSQDQKQKGDLDRQISRLTKYCVEKKYFIVATFEEVSSGMHDDRAKLNKLF